ncbi:MAG: Sapep family Mn(2+)-dependent dipeptidase [Fimbriimonadaceae bacterium]
MGHQGRLETAQQWLGEHESDMLTDLQALLRIPSLESDAEPNAPFGAENRRALDFMLDLAEKAGHTTKDLDGYCGYAEYGTGEKEVLTLGHLDVVPVGPGWTYDPFAATLADDGYIYARGACDDKGPTMMMWYAARAVQHAWPDLPVRLRSFFGCNEESGFQCVHHYTKHEAPPTLGVAPDAGWPLINAEKGISDLIVVVSPAMWEGLGVQLTAFRGGQRPNIVIDHATATVRVTADARDEVETNLKDSWDRNVTAAWDGDNLHIEAVGKAAHGSTPWVGDNAAARVLRFIKDISPRIEAGKWQALLDIFQISGAGVGLQLSDDPSGPLTLNPGIVDLTDAGLRCTLNIRYPVTCKFDDLRARVEAALAAGAIPATVESMSNSSPLYFPTEHPLVEAIISAYEAEEGERLTPRSMGGGTYARAVPNCVAIGTSWSGDGDAHETDERIHRSSLMRTARIYVRLLFNLIEAAQKA